MQITAFSPERLSELIGLVYDSALADRQWKRFMEAICEAFPGCAMTSMASDGEERAWQYEHAGASPEEIALVQERLHSSNDIQRRYHREFLALPAGFVARSRKFMGDEAFHATQLYREVLRPMGFGHFMQMKLGDAEERFIYLFISFREDAPEHERLYDELFRLLALLSPHILRAGRIGRAMRLSREASRLLGGALDTIILPMAVVDAQGGLIFANAAGQRAIDRGGVLGLDAQGRLALPTPPETRALRARLREIDAAGRPGGLRAHQGDEPFSLLVMPFFPSLDRAGQLDGALYGARRAFAVFVGQSEDDAVDPGLLADVFDLTLREAQVCRDLLRGLGPAEIAQASGRSAKTVRNQVQAIHDKLDVTSHRALFDRLATFRAVSHALSGVERSAEAELQTTLGAGGPRARRPRAAPRPGPP